MPKELTALAVLSAGLGVAFTLYCIPKIATAIRRGPLLRGVSPSDIVYRERYASGRSLKNWQTRLGGARSALTITITQNALYTTLSFPFSIFPFSIVASVYDIEQRILKGNISSTSIARRPLRPDSLIIEYLDELGGKARYEVIPNDLASFQRALESSEP